jgi:hypothetical protein
MALALLPGTVIRYPYLWLREARRGETEGRKNRPVCLAIALPLKGKTYLYLLPISSQPPTVDQSAIEIPELELRRIGLAASKRGWITVSEHNRDIAEDSFYFEPNTKPLGRFSDAFLLKIQKAALPFFKSQQARADRRE